MEIELKASDFAPCHGNELDLKIRLDRGGGALTYSGRTGVLVPVTTRSLTPSEVRLVLHSLSRIATLPDEPLPEPFDSTWMMGGQATLLVTLADGQPSKWTAASRLSESEWAELDSDLDAAPPQPASPTGHPPALTRTRLLHRLVKQLTGKTVAQFSDDGAQ